MTTTPIASPELPDLDKLEALARAATAGPWLHRRDPGNPIGAQHCVKLAGEHGAWVCDCIDNADRSTVGGIAGERNAAFIAGANPTAVLALIALARRAQPEGEAPQAIARKRFTEDEVRELALQHLHDDTESAGRNSFFTFSAEGLDGFAIELMDCAAATLSPLCGAQHAESGKESVLSDEWVEAQINAQYAKHIHPSSHDVIRAVVRAALAAQQAAAPGNSPEIPDSSTSAPGTPEAPAEYRKGIELWRATLRACGELPEGYEVRIELENGCGMVVWYDERGERHVIDGEGYLSDDVNEAIELAIQRAAAPKGGA